MKYAVIGVCVVVVAYLMYSAVITTSVIKAGGKVIQGATADTTTTAP